MAAIRVAVAGAAGRMGREVVRGVARAENMTLVAAVDLEHVNEDAGVLAGLPPLGVAVEPELGEALERSRAQVVVDFTRPNAVAGEVECALELGVRPVVGTTGLRPEQVERFASTCEERELGCVIAPNFAVGAVLMMKMSQMAASVLPGVEIIELHHDGKLDSPSGTALLTAAMIAEARGEPPQEPGPPERGLVSRGVRIHSVRLPGLVAHQEVVFGGLGQTLSIRHDTVSREAFIPGVLIAVEKVINLKRLVYGLEHLLDL